MKTDQFDDAIKKKLEGIEPTFQEEDWDKFMAYAHAQKTPFWKILASKSVMYTAAAAVVVVSSVIVTLTQYYAKKDLQQELISVTQQRDSIMADKQKLSEQLSKSQLSPNQRSANPSLTEALAESKQPNASLLDESTLSSSASGKYFSGKKSLGGKGGGLWAGLTDKRNQAFRKAWTNATSNATSNAASKSASQAASKAIVNRNKVNGIDIERSENPVLSSAVSLKPLLGHQALWDSSYRTLATITKTNFGYYQLDTTQEKRWHFSLADAHVRVGGQAYTGPKQQAIGGQVELFLDNRLSITAGLRYVTLTKETYVNDYHFKDFNDFDFRSRFAPKVPFGAPIKNIEIQNTLLQIPIQLSYYMPLSRSFYVFGKVGTDLDLSGTKQVCFDIKDKLELTATKVNSDLETVTLNNYNFSVGFEKRFGPVAIQMSPNYGVNYKPVDYRTNGLGLDLKINYTF